MGIDPASALGIERIAVLGGGVGGLSAAQELAERGFAVTVYEAAPCFGGKARSYRVPGTGHDGRADLPGEHGHRVFAGFYRHLDDTMRRIPFRGQPLGVLGNLVDASAGLFVREGGAAFTMPAHFPRRRGDLVPYLRRWLGQFVDSGLSAAEIATFVGRSLELLACSEQRLIAEYERLSWREFMAPGREPSPRFDQLFLGGWARTFAALDARQASARTMGVTLAQMFLWSQFPGGRRTATRVLDGPTSETFIDPWVDYLRSLGVELRTSAAVERFDCEAGRIAAITIAHGDGTRERVVADAYVSAMPVEAMVRLLDDALVAAAPALAGLRELEVRFMGGVQLYFDRPVPLVHGHVHYGNAPWALTSVSQAQFWSRTDLARLGDGRVRDIVSVAVADWTTPGAYVTDRPAMECTAEVIAEEVYAQMRSHLRGKHARQLDAARRIGFCVDPRIADPEDRPRNCEPLMVNTVDSWRHRPEAGPHAHNLFLASDYVRTAMDFACMEAANEAARRAVNGILERTRVSAPRCGLWPLRPPRVLEPLRRFDAWRWQWRVGA